MTISVCISTKNRQAKLKDFLASLAKNSKIPNELIIVNQGTPINQNILPNKLVGLTKILDANVSNLSIGRNIAISGSHSDILAFTDDDCIVDKNWVRNILNTHNKYPHCKAVFGKISPFKPSQHQKEFCPCTYEGEKFLTISTPKYHATNIGFGNNMSFKKSLFYKIGFFKTWLGVGSVGLSAEDAEFALRTLISKHKIIFNPQIKVFHNKWIKKSEFTKQRLLYVCGETACYGYYFFRGHKFAKDIVKNNFRESYYKFRKFISELAKFGFNKNMFIDLRANITEVIYRIRGLVIATFFHFFSRVFV